VVELLDDLFQRAAAADEPPELNYVRKHAQDIKSQGLGNPAARLFSNPAGDYGGLLDTSSTAWVSTSANPAVDYGGSLSMLKLKSLIMINDI
jgi:magnesium chelatase subunit H